MDWQHSLRLPLVNRNLNGGPEDPHDLSIGQTACLTMGYLPRFYFILKACRRDYMHVMHRRSAEPVPGLRSGVWAKPSSLSLARRVFFNEAVVAVTSCLLLGLCTRAAQAASAQPLFPSEATVVLLAGLPGDVESETAYRDQLQSWLEVLAHSLPLRNVFVLCDNPNAVTASAPPLLTNQLTSFQVLKASRAAFLGVSQTLASGTNPLVVVAWGHGGKQGSTPVLHVAGPRLTAADFSVLAGPHRRSHWVLIFRGSGSFARQLAGTQRDILSSEADTMFTSDPVGTALLLKLVRAEPARSFADLAQEFGNAVASWYKDRNLARTEEPTFWAEEQPPRLLAGEATAEPVGSVESGAEPPPSKSAKPEVASGELTAVWKEIIRVEPQQYPEADAVVLRQRLNYTLATAPAIATEQEEFVQILTPEGKHFGDFDISYSPPSEDISFLECEVLRPDGKLARLDPDAIREAQQESMGDYHLGHRKVFSLPGVVPGAVLHVRYRTEWKDFPLPHISLEIPLDEEVPVREAEIQVSLPKEAAFHFALERSPTALSSHPQAPPSPDPAVTQSSYSTTYTWHFENLEAHEPELLAAPGRHSSLLISTFPDWADFAQWYGRISRLTDGVTPELQAKATELTKGAQTDREKVLALYNYVTGLRYVAVPMGVNSFRPHGAANVLENQFGDCKDKANLLNTLLHCVNIEARLVLVPRFSQAHDEIPGLAFNHAISRVTLGGQNVWVDTTDDVCRFGMLPPGDPGRKVLVIDGQTSALTQLPTPDPKDHRLRLDGKMDCSDPQVPLPITLSAMAFGYPDYELRATAQETKGHQASLPLLAARFRPASGAFALDKQSATSAAALDENFTWHAEGTFVGLASLMDSGLAKGTSEGSKAQEESSLSTDHLPGTKNSPVTLLHAPFWLPREWDLALNRRKAALFLNEGYPLTLDEEFELVLPAKSRLLDLPPVSEKREGPLRWRIEWKQRGERSLTALFHAELASGETSARETPALQQALRELFAGMSSSAAFRR